MKKQLILFMAVFLTLCLSGGAVHAATSIVILNPIADGILGDSISIKGQLRDLSVDTIIIKISKPLGDGAYALYEVKAITADAFINGYDLPTTADTSVMPAGRYRIAVGYDTHKAEATFLLSAPSNSDRDVTDNSGGGGGTHSSGNSGGGITDVPVTTPAQEEKTGFTDVEGEFAWAKTAVDFLHTKGIIAGTDEHSFVPERTITRAEFSQLLVKLFRFGEAAEFSAEDVNQTDWFYEAVSKASAAGVVFGYEDGTFRPNNSISREEMAVMLCRALNASGTSVPEAASEFSDAEEISPWAMQEVASLKGMKLVNGKGDNRFMPKDILSRAEAAQVIYNTYLLTQN